MNRFQLLDRIERTASDSPARIACIELRTGRSLTYADLRTRCSALAGAIAVQLPEGSTALLRSPNRLEFPIWFLALLCAGVNVCPVLPDLTETELRHLARRTNAAAAVGAENLNLRSHWPLESAFKNGAEPCETGRSPGQSHSPFFPSPGPPLVSAGLGGGSFVSFEGHAITVRRPPGDLLLASSGTTGDPKIVRRTAASLDAVSAAMVDAIHFTQTDHVLASVPLSHSYGLEHGLLAPLWAGSTVLLSPGFHMPFFADALAKNISIFPAVPSMIEMLATLADAPEKMPALRVAYSAGAPLPESVNDAFQNRFGHAVGQVYGMTEIGSVTFSDPRSVTFNKSSVGRPMGDISIRVLHLHESNDPLPTNAEGEIAVRAPSILAGYIAEPAELFEGHFRTGDLGYLDSTGTLFLTGRVRLLIDTGGTKVNPIEIEAVISSHPDVRACLIIPVRQSETVNRLRALIVPRNPDEPPTEDSIRQFAKASLAPYKIPRLIEFRSDFPVSPSGKVQRHLVS